MANYRTATNVSDFRGYSITNSIMPTGFTDSSIMPVTANYATKDNFLYKLKYYLRSCYDSAEA